MDFSIVGQGWALPTTSRQLKPNDLGQLISLANEKSGIQQAMGIILMTSPGERVMRPQFGCRIHELVFAPNNRETAVQAERLVTEALSQWEPRITVDRVSAQPAYTACGDRRVRPPIIESAQQAALLIEIDYTVKSTKDERSLVYPFYLIPGE